MRQMRRIAVILLAILFLWVGNVYALDIDVYHVIETHIQDGKVIKKEGVATYRTKAEALRNQPKNYVIPGKTEKVVIPASIETTYWLNEMQNSGSGWYATGRKKGPYKSRAQALQNDPGKRTVRDNKTRYYIRELYLDQRIFVPQLTGKVEGPFSSQAAAKKRLDNLGCRNKISNEYTASLYLDDFFLASRREGPGIKLLSRTYHYALSDARNGVKSLLARTSTAGNLKQTSPVPAAAINAYNYYGVISKKANLVYSAYKVVALGRRGAYVGLAECKETVEGFYYWQLYSENSTQTVNYRWDVNTINNHIPENIKYMNMPPTNVTYSVEEEIVSLKVETYLIQ